jgi:hypothetical protein
MDIHHLSAWLFFYQILVAAVLSPLIFKLQGEGVHAVEILALNAHMFINHPR